MSELTLQYAPILSHFLRWCTGWAIIAMVLVGDATVEASIIGPNLPEFRFQTAAQSSSGRSSASADSAPSAPTEQHVIEIVQHALATSNSSSSGTSSSTTGISSGANTTFALSSVAMFSDANLALTGWVAAELRFSLPTAEGNDLLRPPQGV